MLVLKILEKQSYIPLELRKHPDETPQRLTSLSDDQPVLVQQGRALVRRAWARGGPDETEDHPQQDGQRETSKSGIKADPKVITPIVLQAYFFSKELADKMNATEIKETFNQQKGHKNIACSVLQLKYPYEGHFIYFHTFEGRFKLPYECTLFTGFRVTLEPPRKKIDRLCDCKKVDWGYNC